MDIKLKSVCKLTLVHVFLTLLPVSCQTYENATTLRSTLLSGYNKEIRPLNNQSGIVQISLTLDLYAITEVDSVNGVVTLSAALSCQWMDERMTWTPSYHGGITKISFLMNEVWTPTIALGTPVEFNTMGTSKNHVTFFANGLAFFYPGSILKSSCGFYMKFWPFDKQTCDVTFYPMDYLTDQVVLSINSDGINTSPYTPNAEWTLEKSSEHYVNNKLGISIVFFKLKLQRQSLFYVLTIILPINGIACLTCLAFLLPSESGERVSFAITIMLSLAVFLTVVSAEMPKSSNPVSLMCCYILVGIVASVIGVVLAILNLVIYHRKEDIPKRHWYISLVYLTRCKRQNKIQDELEALRDIKSTTNTNEPKIIFPERKINKNVLLVTSAVQEQRQEETITWQDVSYAIDKVMFYTMVFLICIPSIAFLVYLAEASDYKM